MDGPTLSLETGEGANAADPNAILAALSGRGVVTGGEVHAASEPFALQVMSTDGWFASPKADLEGSITDGNVAIGSHVQPQSATFSVRELGDDTYPRKILVCVARDGDGNRAGGDYHVVAGEPAQARPQDFTEVKNTSEPGLPDLADRPDLLPLAGCWIGGNADGVADDHVWDRRHQPDAVFRELYVSHVIASELTDPGGVRHDGALADLADNTPEAHREDINTDPDHGSSASHNYRTDSQIRGAITDEVDVDELSAANGTAGQLPFVNSTGDAPVWNMPPDEWGSLQALIDAAAAAGVTPSFVDIEVGDQTLTNSITWPDGTTTTTSPSQAAGNVALLADLGDVQRGAYADRHPPDGSSDIYFAETGATRGVYHDDPANSPAAWSALAIHPADIDPGDLGFDPATQQELGSHTDRSDNPHGVTAAQAGALGASETATAAESAATATKAAALIDESGTTAASGFVHSGDGDLTYKNGVLTHWNGHSSIHGERSVSEVERWVGDTTDVVRMVYGGTNHHLLKNAYFDGSDFRYLVSNEPASRWQMSSSARHVFSSAAAGLSGEVIDWQEAIIEGGSIDKADNSAALGGHDAGQYPRRDNTSQWETILNFDVYGPENATNDIRTHNISGGYHMIKVFLQTSANTDTATNVRMKLGTDGNYYNFALRDGNQYTNYTNKDHMTVLEKNQGAPYNFVSEIIMRGDNVKSGAPGNDGMIVTATGSSSGRHLSSGYMSKNTPPDIELYAVGGNAGNVRLAGEIVGKKFS